MTGIKKNHKIAIGAVLLLVAIVVIYHLIVVASFGRAKFGLLGSAYVKLNPITNTITFDVDGYAENGPRALALAGPLIEKRYQSMSKERFDVYAMVLPYSIASELQTD